MFQDKKETLLEEPDKMKNIILILLTNVSHVGLFYR